MTCPLNHPDVGPTLQQLAAGRKVAMTREDFLVAYSKDGLTKATRQVLQPGEMLVVPEFWRSSLIANMRDKPKLPRRILVLEYVAEAVAIPWKGEDGEGGEPERVPADGATADAGGPGGA